MDKKQLNALIRRHQLLNKESMQSRDEKRIKAIQKELKELKRTIDSEISK